MENQSAALTTQQAVELALARRDAQAAKDQVEQLEQEVRDLRADLDDLETRTGIISPSLFVRVFTVWGHYFLAQLILAALVLAVVFVVSMMIGLRL